MPWPDTEKALTVLFEQLVDDPEQTGTATPAKLDRPFLRVTVIGGPRDAVTDFASLDIDAFASSRQDAFDLCNDAIALLESSHEAGGVLIDTVTVTTRPARRPWANDNIRRFGATCTVTTRRQ